MPYIDILLEMQELSTILPTFDTFLHDFSFGFCLAVYQKTIYCHTFFRKYFQLFSFSFSVRPSLEPGWLEGNLDGRRGLVPENYVEFIA